MNASWIRGEGKEITKNDPAKFEQYFYWVLWSSVWKGSCSSGKRRECLSITATRKSITLTQPIHKSLKQINWGRKNWPTLQKQSLHLKYQEADIQTQKLHPVFLSSLQTRRQNSSYHKGLDMSNWWIQTLSHPLLDNDSGKHSMLFI